MGKEKINLSINGEIIKKARNQHINISRFLERMLRVYTSAKKPEGDIYETYNQLFESVLPLLKEFDCRIKVAKGVDPSSFEDKGNIIYYERPVSIYLMPDGSIYFDEDDRYFEDIREIHKKHFLRPKKILTNLVNALSKSKEVRDNQLNEILMAKDIVEAMSKRLIKRYKIVE